MFDVYVDGWKKMLEIEGRATRTQFWTFVLGNLIGSLLVSLVLVFLLPILAPVAWVLDVLVFIAELTIGARRLHDTKRSALNLLWWLLPVVGWIILLVFFLQPSKR